jgi:hypothetical protein
LRSFACESAARKPGHTGGHSKGSACRDRASGGNSGRATDHSPPLSFAGAAFRIVLASLSKTWPGSSGRPGGAHGVCFPFAALILPGGRWRFRFINPLALKPLIYTAFLAEDRTPNSVIGVAFEQ